MVIARGAVISLALLGILTGCGEEPAAETSERIRAIKPYTVSEPAGGDVGRYSGTIGAATTSTLSFAMGGTVEIVVVKQGDRVEAGQVLATLDPERANLDVAAAKSQLDSAHADFTDKNNELDRKRQLFDKGWVARAAVDQAVAASDGAEGQLNLARSRLGSAERDLAKTSLVAPFDGVIASRDVQPFQEVASGQPVFLINSEDSLEIVLSVPDSVITRLSVGAPVTVDVTNIAGCGCAARVTEISPQSGAANAVSVTAALLDNPTGLLPGMAAEVSVVLSGGRASRGFLVPLVAIAPGDDTAPGYIFKYDEATGSVSKVAVRGGSGVAENLIEIVEGVAAGDIIAAAGVSFLRDGQRVKLLGQ